jgi:putative redox protein
MVDDRKDLRMPRIVEVMSGDVGYFQKIQIGPHRLYADETVGAGGGDAGPDPHELLLAALGSCTSMTIRMYAKRKQWSLESVHVRLMHDRIHAEDGVGCETKSSVVDRIKREISLLGDLTDEQRRRLVEIANRCPVHRTLTSKIHIETHLTYSIAVGNIAPTTSLPTKA